MNPAKSVDHSQFPVGLELLATVASLPNECLLELSPEKEKNNNDTLNSTKSYKLKKKYTGSADSAESLVLHRLNSLRKLSRHPEKCVSNKKVFDCLFSLVQHDVRKLIKAARKKSKPLDAASSCKTPCLVNQFSQTESTDERPGTLVSPSPSIDFDNLEPSVLISTVDFPSSFPSQAATTESTCDLMASGHLLDSFLEKVEQRNSTPASPAPQVESDIKSDLKKIEFDPKEQHLRHTFVNMFWNTFPALKADDGRTFIRLADISATALPAKDSSILKSRCVKLGLPVSCCTDMQRNFLVKYCFGSHCRSTFMIDSLSARSLIASYSRDKLKELNLKEEDMQVVVLSEEDSQRLISSRLNLCSSKYIGSPQNNVETVPPSDGSHFLRRRASKPQLAKKNSQIALETNNSEPALANTSNAIPSQSATSEVKSESLLTEFVLKEPSSHILPNEIAISPSRKRKSPQHRKLNKISDDKIDSNVAFSQGKITSSTKMSRKRKKPDQSVAEPVNQVSKSIPVVASIEKPIISPISIAPAPVTKKVAVSTTIPQVSINGRTKSVVAYTLTKVTPVAGRPTGTPIIKKIVEQHGSPPRVFVRASRPITIRVISQSEEDKSMTCDSGVLVPHLYVGADAPCVQCVTCRSHFSPNGFSRHCGGGILRPEGEFDKTAWLEFREKYRNFQSSAEITSGANLQ